MFSIQMTQLFSEIWVFESFVSFRIEIIKCVMINVFTLTNICILHSIYSFEEQLFQKGVYIMSYLLFI